MHHIGVVRSNREKAEKEEGSYALSRAGQGSPAGLLSNYFPVLKVIIAHTNIHTVDLEWRMGKVWKEQLYYSHPLLSLCTQAIHATSWNLIISL